MMTLRAVATVKICMRMNCPSDRVCCSVVGQDANGKRSAPRADMPSLADEKGHAKRFKAAEVRPVHASDKVWASIFTSSRPEAKETYGCRALSSRGLA